MNFAQCPSFLRLLRYVHTSPHTVLGVSSASSQTEIRNAFLHLAKQHHPDMNKDDPSAHAKFVRINEAYRTLRHPTNSASAGPAPPKREKKERPAQKNGKSKHSREFWFDMNEEEEWWQSEKPFSRWSQEDHDWDEEEVWEEIHSKGPGRPTRMEEVKLHLTFAEAALGCRKDVHLPGRSRKIEIDIQPGTFSGKDWMVSRNGNGGDLRLTITVEDQNIFKYKGHDLYVTIPITLTQALLGGQVSVPTLTEPLFLSIPHGVQSGDEQVIKGRGLRHRNHAGDLRLTWKVVLPPKAKLTQLQTEALQMFAEDEVPRNNPVPHQGHPRVKSGGPTPTRSPGGPRRHRPSWDR
eukprot:NODE_2726_length_1109_cov_52.570265_g2602_i0.p1 GENE.NODE_2726_length_1109_cov_52.570265_g2602_i0~~NODE_2726_length_1109_cov_52.570265_g2602_i0.p1  ORF type:complete len:366 (+),score=96.28 NODE_2726_length_1109_cov_52.570265_g2602_i0:50-1099(+)